MLWSKSGEILCAMEQIPCKICSLRLILIYHFVFVARKQDTVTIRWLSQYVECSKPGNPLGAGICLALCLKATKHKKETKLAGRTDWEMRFRHTSLIIYSKPPKQCKLEMALKPAVPIRPCIAIATRAVCGWWMEKVCSCKSTWSECLQWI